MTIKIKKLDEKATIPKFAKEDDAGMDFYSTETVRILPSQRYTISTGISMAIPKGYVGLIWDKSGVASKNGIKTMGGVIDSGYRGEIKIIVHNLSNEPYLVEEGKKIAQMLIQKVEQKEIIEVEELDITERGDSGFGSTGF